MKSLLILFDNVVGLYIWILIINAIISWLVAFNVLNTSNRFVYSILDVSYKLTDPPLNYIRRFLPNLGSIDISPIVLILGLMFFRNLIAYICNISDYGLTRRIFEELWRRNVFTEKKEDTKIFYLFNPFNREIKNEICDTISWD